jgi:hypothetical protein
MLRLMEEVGCWRLYLIIATRSKHLAIITERHILDVFLWLANGLGHRIGSSVIQQNL